MELIPNAKLYVYYGLTEASRSTFIKHSKDKQSLLNSVGKSSPNVNIAVLDKNSKIRKNNSEGEILIKGNNVMKEYWCDTSRSKNSFLNGWFKTGDLGLIDRNGYLFVTGRIKDMINIGGLKTSSNEINDAYNKDAWNKRFSRI